MKKKRLLFIILAIVLIIGSTCAGIAYYYLFSPIIGTKQTTYIYIDNQDTVESIIQKIKKEGNVKQLQGFEYMASYYGYKEHIKTGRYAIHPNDNSLQLYRRLSRGQQTPINLIIPSVRTIDKLAQSISKQLMLDSIDIAAPLTDSIFCAQLGYTPQTIACLFIPNTYEVYWNISPEGFFKRMQKENRNFWNKNRLEEAEAIGFTPEEITIIASIVEEETANNQEKNIIAGLYINRLHKGMLLQADPTVKFAMQDFTLKRILNVHLTIDSPYNTYKYAGLPPGPIRIPSISGIESVLHYARHNYLYMCAKEDFSGTHNFTSSLTQHNINAQRYQRELNRKRIK